MGKYTLTSYEPVSMELPKPQVPDSLVDAQIEKLLEPLAEYHEIEEDRGAIMGDFLVVTTENACIDGNPAKNFILQHSLYHTGGGEMPRSFDDELMGMEAGTTKDVVAKIKLPLAKDGDASALTMTVTVEKILYCVQPELTDELVKEHFQPANTVAEFREGVASQFGLKDMQKNDPQFPDLVLEKLAERLVEEPDEADRMEGMPTDALRAMCAIDALADHLAIELSDEDVMAQMPGEDAEQREKILAQLQEQGLADEARVFARREAALSWLVNSSRVSYK
ncbi:MULTISPECIES: hypothetical protein [Gordonibacter]|uniref:Trigger factor n=1 Tax=Gordonibacter faecis TaxID=3047475 RepID=A0ABT7DJD9_9ACTN|nr:MULTISPECIES: hypothetical protein [unclassified Gordonibacter]MDJ1649646.1 hypothetical protein [Gordonibacter sp. KGMB12511]HIW76449.1 hypothetical protein [Candidatus Gordonibacter avicola]